jgi:ribosomal protein S12 methylthiotransferase
MLKAMRRGITKEKTTELVNDIRKKVPGITIRTTLITGYPGETEEDFLEMCDWVAEMKFDRLGVFPYSHEENTHAFEFVDDVTQDEKQQRAEKIMEIQRDISLELNQKKIGQIFKVLFDRVEGDHFIGRTEFDSPEVDNEVLVPKKDSFVRLGDFAMVEITDATEYDLIGKLV